MADTNFDKLVSAGLADKDNFEAQEQAAINRLSGETVNKIIAAARARGLTGAGGQQ